MIERLESPLLRMFCRGWRWLEAANVSTNLVLRERVTALAAERRIAEVDYKARGLLPST